ncbi:hypothetical protein [Brevifollis gellanilyticus]|uniref:Uncharacterized protein n=1 Tax=Brevifollis gellanilyticus TaxID=748831 RepID=A0A512M7E7_9BACT|nr:hypothetical protein [Brevifollis gellanilyticus]GEP42660.1 hypothetical protein BGE01nite_19510 [Brevifollis gellanilyticus]
MARVEKVPVSGFSPFYGCLIMVMAALVFGGIIAWSAYSLFQQDKAIAVFASDQPQKFAPIELSAEARAALEKKLADFKAGQTTELTLSIAELNGLLLIAPDTGYGTYTEMLRFERTEPEKNRLIAQVCLPMNHIKFWEDKKRYLNGEAAYEVLVHEAGVDAQVADVKVPGKVVAEGFVTGMATWTLLAPYAKLDAIGPSLKLVKKATVTADGVTLSTKG